MLRRHELSDSQWEFVRKIIPGKATDPGRSGKDNRRFLNAVLYVARTGIPWRDLPERFGRWNSVWRRFDRWCANGVWTKITAILGEPDLEELQLDSTSVKVHQSACGSRRRSGEKKRKPITDDASAARVVG
jgi:putative transposase